MSAKRVGELSIVVVAAAFAAACGAADDGAQPTPRKDAGAATHDAGSTPDPLSTRDAGGPIPAADAGADGCPTFDSTFAALQHAVFEGHGCTAAACHGEALAGGLDLRAAAAYASLVDARSTNSPHPRVQPGSATESFLYEKLRAATEPGSIDINGSPMPVAAAPLSADELEAVRIWIARGAPQTGTVADPTSGIEAGSLLGACLPPATPVPIPPLEPPAQGEGIQFILPEYVLESGTEVENCVPFAYDFTSRVPAEFKDEARNVMFVNSMHVRQDSVSHHMVVWNPTLGLDSVSPTDPAWTCRGGPTPGRQCNARNGSADCGELGVCGGPMTDGTLCGVDITPLSSGNGDPIEAILALLQLLAGGGLPEQLANTQSPQEYLPPMEGVFWELPLRGVLWFNSHAFNLTREDTTLHARMNFFYGRGQRRMVAHNEIRNNTPVGQPPFTTRTYCETYVVPQNNSIAIMTGHTHRHGEHFWVTNARDEMIYENFVYNDPVYQRYRPWLEFPQLDAAARTLEFCATFNNGLAEDGSPDVEQVTRASRMPGESSCTPVACVAGKPVGTACTTNADCDSTAGAGDGNCDACPIAGGVTTENEMFVLMPWLILPPGQ